MHLNQYYDAHPKDIITLNGTPANKENVVTAKKGKASDRLHTAQNNKYRSSKLEQDYKMSAERKVKEELLEYHNDKSKYENVKDGEKYERDQDRNEYYDASPKEIINLNGTPANKENVVTARKDKASDRLHSEQHNKLRSSNLEQDYKMSAERKVKEELLEYHNDKRKYENAKDGEKYERDQDRNEHYDASPKEIINLNGTPANKEIVVTVKKNKTSDRLQSAQNNKHRSSKLEQDYKMSAERKVKEELLEYHNDKHKYENAKDGEKYERGQDRNEHYDASPKEIINLNGTPANKENVVTARKDKGSDRLHSEQHNKHRSSNLEQDYNMSAERKVKEERLEYYNNKRKYENIKDGEIYERDQDRNEHYDASPKEIINLNGTSANKENVVTAKKNKISDRLHSAQNNKHRSSKLEQDYKMSAERKVKEEVLEYHNDKRKYENAKDGEKYERDQDSNEYYDASPKEIINLNGTPANKENVVTARKDKASDRLHSEQHNKLRSSNLEQDYKMSAERKVKEELLEYHNDKRKYENAKDGEKYERGQDRNEHYDASPKEIINLNGTPANKENVVTAKKNKTSDRLQSAQNNKLRSSKLEQNYKMSAERKVKEELLEYHNDKRKYENVKDEEKYEWDQDRSEHYDASPKENINLNGTPANKENVVTAGKDKASDRLHSEQNHKHRSSKLEQDYKMSAERKVKDKRLKYHNNKRKYENVKDGEKYEWDQDRNEHYDASPKEIINLNGTPANQENVTAGKDKASDRLHSEQNHKHRASKLEQDYKMSAERKVKEEQLEYPNNKRKYKNINDGEKYEHYEDRNEYYDASPKEIINLNGTPANKENVVTARKGKASDRLHSEQNNKHRSSNLEQDYKMSAKRKVKKEGPEYHNNKLKYESVKDREKHERDQDRNEKERNVYEKVKSRDERKTKEAHERNKEKESQEKMKDRGMHEKNEKRERNQDSYEKKSDVHEKVKSKDEGKTKEAHERNKEKGRQEKMKDRGMHVKNEKRERNKDSHEKESDVHEKVKSRDEGKTKEAHERNKEKESQEKMKDRGMHEKNEKHERNQDSHEKKSGVHEKVKSRDERKTKEAHERNKEKESQEKMKDRGMHEKNEKCERNQDSYEKKSGIHEKVKSKDEGKTKEAHERNKEKERQEKMKDRGMHEKNEKRERNKDSHEKESDVHEKVKSRDEGKTKEAHERNKEKESQEKMKDRGMHVKNEKREWNQDSHEKESDVHEKVKSRDEGKTKEAHERNKEKESQEQMKDRGMHEKNDKHEQNQDSHEKKSGVHEKVKSGDERKTKEVHEMNKEKESQEKMKDGGMHEKNKKCERNEDSHEKESDVHEKVKSRDEGKTKEAHERNKEKETQEKMKDRWMHAKNEKHDYHHYSDRSHDKYSDKWKIHRDKHHHHDKHRNKDNWEMYSSSSSSTASNMHLNQYDDIPAKKMVNLNTTSENKENVATTKKDKAANRLHSEQDNKHRSSKFDCDNMSAKRKVKEEGHEYHCNKRRHETIKDREKHEQDQNKHEKERDVHEKLKIRDVVKTKEAHERDNEKETQENMKDRGMHGKNNRNDYDLHSDRSHNKYRDERKMLCDKYHHCHNKHRDKNYREKYSSGSSTSSRDKYHSYDKKYSHSDKQKTSDHKRRYSKDREEEKGRQHKLLPIVFISEHHDSSSRRTSQSSLTLSQSSGTTNTDNSTQSSTNDTSGELFMSDKKVHVVHKKNQNVAKRPRLSQSSDILCDKLKNKNKKKARK